MNYLTPADKLQALEVNQYIQAQNATNSWNYANTADPEYGTLMALKKRMQEVKHRPVSLSEVIIQRQEERNE